MLDPKFVRDNPEIIKTMLRARNMAPELCDDFLSADTRWRELTDLADRARHELKKASEVRDIEKAKKVKTVIKEYEAELAPLEARRQDALDRIPNMPNEGVPQGKSDADNIVLREIGKKNNHATKDYLTLAESFDLIDTKQSAIVSGSRFSYLKGELVMLEFALIQFAMERATAKGFTPVIPPVMIKSEPYRRMGRLSGDQKEERFYLEKDDLYLVGSSEHTIGPMHMDETLAETDLPKRYVGFSTCFRREAGSYGKDTKGIFRVHQFDKVEFFVFSKPEESNNEHEKLLALQEELMSALELPYRVVEVCTGDMGFTDAKQFDIETWLPSERRYRETQSCSNTSDFQARGISAKYKSAQASDKKQAAQFVHMLNGTGFAIGRMLIMILENYQTEKGTIMVPKVLQKYVGFKEISISQNVD